MKKNGIKKKILGGRRKYNSSVAPEYAKSGFPVSKENFLANVSKMERKWYENFLKRHPEISLRTPESIFDKITEELIHNRTIPEPIPSTICLQNTICLPITSNKINVVDIQVTDSQQKTPLKESFDPNIPSPFKKALFWPGPKNNTSIKKKENIPSVATSELWQEYSREKLRRET